MKRDIAPAAEAERMLALREEFGYRSFKFRIAAECGHDVDQWPGRSEEIVRTMREVLGDEVTLMVDANSGYTPKKAIEVGHMLADYGVSHYEEPCPYWQLDWTRQVTEALDIDVTGGEQDNNLTVWKQMIDTCTVDVVQPDICYGDRKRRQVCRIFDRGAGLLSLAAGSFQPRFRNQAGQCHNPRQSRLGRGNKSRLDRAQRLPG
jgi:L-alanine-DL-glutamate epimerase-like enolase superfamily enzyme